MTDLYAIEDVYAGRTVKLAGEAAAALGVDLSVVSAGLGFVSGGTKIPSYDLTISAGSEASVQAKINRSFDPIAWWIGLQGGPFSSSLTNALVSKSSVLIALSEPYAKMIAGDLETLANAGCALHIFGSSLARHLPTALKPHVMPYDERLSELMSGTKTDFPQRALHHFVHNVARKGLALAEERAAVSKALASVRAKPRVPPVRARHSDIEIAAIIKTLPPGIGRSKSKSLGFLRREMGIACEQNRFSQIFESVGAQNGDR